MFHSVELRAYAHATEDEGRVETALRTLCADGDITLDKTEGHYGNPIVLMTSRLEKPPEIQAFWRRLGEVGVLADILETIDDRVDEDAVLHLRFDKQKAFEGTIDLARHDDVVVCRAKVVAHPAKKSVATRVARDYLGRI